MILAVFGHRGASKMVISQGWSSLKYSGIGSGSASQTIAGFSSGLSLVTTQTWPVEYLKIAFTASWGQSPFKSSFQSSLVQQYASLPPQAGHFPPLLPHIVQQFPGNSYQSKEGINSIDLSKILPLFPDWICRSSCLKKRSSSLVTSASSSRSIKHWVSGIKWFMQKLNALFL